MQETKRYRPKAGYMLEMVDNELLIYHPSEALVIYCNTTAALVWQLLDGERSDKQIATLLAESYPQEDASVRDDVHQTLQHMHAQGAIELVSKSVSSQ